MDSADGIRAEAEKELYDYNRKSSQKEIRKRVKSRKRLIVPEKSISKSREIDDFRSFSRRQYFRESDTPLKHRSRSRRGDDKYIDARGSSSKHQHDRRVKYRIDEYSDSLYSRSRDESDVYEEKIIEKNNSR